MNCVGLHVGVISRYVNGSSSTKKCKADETRDQERF